MIIIMTLLSNVAQWLGRWSLADVFSLPRPDLWLIGDHFLGKLPDIGQPIWPTQPSIPQLSVNQ